MVHKCDELENTRKFNYHGRVFAISSNKDSITSVKFNLDPYDQTYYKISYGIDHKLKYIQEFLEAIQEKIKTIKQQIREDNKNASDEESHTCSDIEETESYTCSDIEEEVSDDELVNTDSKSI